MAGIIDSLLCDVNAADFEESCRAPFYGDQFNRWELWVKDDKQPNAKLEAQIKNAFYRYTIQQGHRIRGPVSFTFGGKAPWPEAAIVTNAEHACPGTQLTIDGPGRRCWVEFVWRGPSQELPWLSLKQSGPLAISCPVGADVQLRTVYSPSPQGVPTVDSSVPPAVASAAEIAKGGVKFATEDWFGTKPFVVVGGLVVGLAALAILSKR